MKEAASKSYMLRFHSFDGLETLPGRKQVSGCQGLRVREDLTVKEHRECGRRRKCATDGCGAVTQNVQLAKLKITLKGQC